MPARSLRLAFRREFPESGAMSTTFGWLHFTDLHRGMTSQKRWWSDWETKLLADLRARHRYAGPWDLVLFTGDLTERGTAPQFAQVDAFADRLWKLFRELQPERPVGLLPVPGNHDLQRPDPDDAEFGSDLELLGEWGQRPKVREKFWSDASSRYRRVVERAFAEYMAWAGRSAGRHPGLRIRAGLFPGVPGDFAATMEKEGAKIGILGLNSAFLQLGGGDYEKRLALDYQQFDAACGGHGPEWAREHHLCLLLTHHPRDWLGPDARVELGRIVAGNFALHLHGHMHETAYRALSVGGGATQRSWQGISLFGEEGWEGGKVDRRFGYAIGRVELRGREGTLRLWPRKAKPPQEDGGWELGPDDDHCRLDDESRNATYPETIPLHHEIASAPAPPPREARPPPDPGGYVHRETEERVALANLDRPGKPVALWAPARFGKRHLLNYLLGCVRAADGEDSRIVEVHLSLLLPDPPTFDGLLQSLAAYLVDRLSGDEAWLAKIESKRRLGWPVKLSTLLEDHLLPASPRRLVLAVDAADAVWGLPFQSAFFGMLRSFCERIQEPWPRLRLILLLSSTPSLTFKDSPLTNLAQTIELGDFTPEQAAEMARLRGLAWDRDSIERLLRPLVGGHPFLLRVLMEHAQHTGVSLEALTRDRDRVEDLFAEHLAEIGGLLDRDANLREALQLLLADEKRRPAEDVLLRLRRAGLVDRAPGGGHRIRYGLYDTYLRRRWQTGPPA
jgi:hypothetical protein